MDEREDDWLVERFEARRPHLRAVAYRMLGSLSEAEDAVQDAWLRLSRADTSDVQNPDGLLTTVISRVCLDHLRSRRARREEPLDAPGPGPIASHGEGLDPEQEALLADSVGLAMLIVLQRLTPAERIAFVLHDMFSLPFDTIARIVGRSETAARQLASRARRRVQGATVPDGDLGRQREVGEAFRAASQNGDLATLLAVLDLDVVLRADPAAVQMGAPGEVRGAAAVAALFSGRAQVARPALVGGAVGLAWAPGGRPRVAFAFTIAGGKIVEIQMIADRDDLRRLDVVLLDG